MPSTPHGRLVLTDEHGGRRGWVLALALVLVAVGVWYSAGDLRTVVLGTQCRASAAGQTMTWSPEQMDNAATIVAVAMERGLPPRAATIAVATAIQESKLRNISYGDRDSVGLFQQRPSQGWGTVEQILVPEYAAGVFYDELVTIDGYETMEITQVAQLVQRSAFPDAYADHELEGRVLASALTGLSTAGIACRLPEPTGPTDLATLQEDLQEHTGLAATRGDDATVRLNAGDERRAWFVASWAVAKAQRHDLTAVTVGDRTWRRSARGEPGWVAADTPVEPGVVVLDLGPDRTGG